MSGSRSPEGSGTARAARVWRWDTGDGAPAERPFPGGLSPDGAPAERPPPGGLSPASASDAPGGD
eukprot:5987234-Prymnesium_polylepis.1